MQTYKMPAREQKAFDAVMNHLRAADAAKIAYASEPTRVNYRKLVAAQLAAIGAMKAR